jgi:predicted nuclease with TOPRIM domain
MHKKELYQEMMDLVLDRIEWENQAFEEFIQLDHQRKKEFLKELMLLNMKELGELFETIKGVKNTFKLKPKVVEFTLPMVKKKLGVFFAFLMRRTESIKRGS